MPVNKYPRWPVSASFNVESKASSSPRTWMVWVRFFAVFVVACSDWYESSAMITMAMTADRNPRRVFVGRGNPERAAPVEL